MQKNLRRYSWLCILLSILLISTFLPLPEIAHAEVETNTNTNANGFIENIVIAQAINSLEQIPNYNFDPQVSHYEIEIPAVYANMKPTIAITLNQDAGNNLTGNRCTTVFIRKMRMELMRSYIECMIRKQ